MEENQENLQATQVQLPAIPQKSDAEIKSIEKWQNKILLWLIGMPTILIAVFIFMASKQVDNFNQAINIKTDTTLFTKILPALNNKADGSVADPKLLKWSVLAHLEQESMYRRYNQGGLLLLSRIFVKYFGFFTGMILTILGAVFIVGKLSDNYSQVGGSLSEHAKFSVVSSSPGIIFGVLGTALMMSTILQHNDIVIQDTPLYLNANSIMSINTDDLLTKKPAASNPVLDTKETDSMFDTSKPKKK